MENQITSLFNNTIYRILLSSKILKYGMPIASTLNKSPKVIRVTNPPACRQNKENIPKLQNLYRDTQDTQRITVATKEGTFIVRFRTFRSPVPKAIQQY